MGSEENKQVDTNKDLLENELEEEDLDEFEEGFKADEDEEYGEIYSGGWIEDEDAFEFDEEYAVVYRGGKGKVLVVAYL